MSTDRRHSFFYIQLVASSSIEQDRRNIVNGLVDRIRTQFPHAHVSGPPILNESYALTIYWETILFAVLTIVVILLLLYLLLPHWQYLPMAFLSVVIPVSISLGMMTSLGYSLNLISMIIPTVLMVYGISDTIHIINIFHQYRLKHPKVERQAQIKAALQISLKPCFYTTLTTIIGYLALSLSPLPAFRIMGLFTFIGLMLSFFLVYVITAIGFYYLGPASLSQSSRSIRLDGLINRIAAWTSHRQGLILGAGSMVFVLGMFSLSKIEANTNFLHLLRQGKTLEDLKLIEEKLGGNARLQMNIYRQDGTSMFSLDELDKLSLFQSSLDTNSLLAHPVSLVNVQEFLEKRTTVMPQLNSQALEEVLREAEAEADAFFSLYSDNFEHLSINILVQELETKDSERLLAGIRSAFAEVFPSEEYGLKIHGFSALYAELNQYILQTQLRSFGAAFLLAFCILFYFIGHFKTSLLALIPNVLPLCLALILMALAGIHLEAANAMLAPIMLGVAMDDTIHLIHRFQLHREEGESVSVSMDQALSFTGNALLSTTLSLLCGFLVVGTSGVISVSMFGLLCAFTIVAALVADMVFLPTLVKRFL